jgi:hypothetical protein
VFGIDEALAALDAALWRLREGHEVVSQPAAPPAGTRVQASWLGQAGMKSLKHPWQQTYMSACQLEVGVAHGP